MLPADAPPPELSTFERLAREAFDRLPEFVKSRCEGLVIAVAEEAGPEVLADLGMGDALDLTGLYEGVALTDRSESDPVQLPALVWLYRRAILAEWQARQNVSLDHLIGHVLVHEIAHHFGYSDDDIAEIDQWWL